MSGVKPASPGESLVLSETITAEGHVYPEEGDSEAQTINVAFLPNRSNHEDDHYFVVELPKQNAKITLMHDEFFGLIRRIVTAWFTS